MYAMLMIKIFPANANMIGYKTQITTQIIVGLENIFNNFPQPEGEIVSALHSLL